MAVSSHWHKTLEHHMCALSSTYILCEAFNCSYILSFYCCKIVFGRLKNVSGDSLIILL